MGTRPVDSLIRGGIKEAPRAMTTPLTYSATLTCHPGTSCAAVRGIEARVSWTGAGALAFAYLLRGDLTRLRIPPPASPRRADGLWQHTCFEAFVAVKDKMEYYEFNFAPSGAWAAYVFQAYRIAGQSGGIRSAPRITVHGTSDNMELNALVKRDWLPVIEPGARVKLALCAVIEEESGRLSYWALNHPPGKPDFHHPDSFALEIGPPDAVVVRESVMVKR